MDARILVIDDDAAIRELLTMILSEENYQVTQHSAFYGLDPIVAAQPDLILLDARMPQLSGIAASQMLKKHPQTSSIPIIAMSASAAKDIASMHCDAYLLKPFDVDNLLQQVAQLLKSRQPRFAPIAG